MKPLKNIGFILVCFFGAVAVKGQEADATLSQKEILIGEQAVINLSVSFTKGEIPEVQFPVLEDTVVTQVEIVRTTEIDTLTTSEEVRETRMEKKLFITSWDTGYYAIPPFEFLIDGEIQTTEAFLLTVRTVEIDTTAGIKPPRKIYEVDVTWTDYLTAYWYYPVGGLALAGLIVAAVLLIRRMKKRDLKKPEPVVREPEKPADRQAIERLEEIHQKKIYTRGKVKAHHTEITDTLRDYIEAIYQIPAHELTSNQILGRLRYVGLTERESLQLREVLMRADMVKFAKEKPSEDENESAVIQSLEFVKTTAARMMADKEIHE